MLNHRLVHLVDEDVLERVRYSEHPPRFDYVLTEQGRDLWPVIVALRQWGDRWRAPDGPPVQLAHRACGHVAELIPVCSECGATFGPGDVTAVPGPGADGDAMSTATELGGQLSGPA